MIVAAIPVKNQIRWTAPLVEGLLLGDKVDEVWIYDNGSTDETKAWVENRSNIDHRLKYVDAQGKRIYDMWNDMIIKSSEMDNVKLAILNNDIRLPFMALFYMSEMMIDHKVLMIDKGVSSFSVPLELHIQDAHWYDKTGWAFMIDSSFWKGQPWAIYPDFKFWWGDDDLFRRCENGGGKIGIAKNIGCDHVEHSSDNEYPGDRIRDIEEDRKLFNDMWL